MLIAVEEDDDSGNLVVRQVSEVIRLRLPFRIHRVQSLTQGSRMQPSFSDYRHATYLASNVSHRRCQTLKQIYCGTMYSSSMTRRCLEMTRRKEVITLKSSFFLAGENREVHLLTKRKSYQKRATDVSGPAGAPSIVHRQGSLCKARKRITNQTQIGVSSSSNLSSNATCTIRCILRFSRTFIRQVHQVRWVEVGRALL